MVDDEFLRECLQEARDGETVTISAPRRQWDAMMDRLVELGATAREMRRITFKNVARG